MKGRIFGVNMAATLLLLVTATVYAHDGNSSTGRADDARPNILWIITDDQRLDSLACYNRAVTGRAESRLAVWSSGIVDGNEHWTDRYDAGGRLRARTWSAICQSALATWRATSESKRLLATGSIQRSGSLTESGEYIKFGRIRITLPPKPLRDCADRGEVYFKASVFFPPNHS